MSTADPAVIVMAASPRLPLIVAAGSRVVVFVVGAAVVVPAAVLVVAGVGAAVVVVVAVLVCAALASVEVESKVITVTSTTGAVKAADDSASMAVRLACSVARV